MTRYREYSLEYRGYVGLSNFNDFKERLRDEDYLKEIKFSTVSFCLNYAIQTKQIH